MVFKINSIFDFCHGLLTDFDVLLVVIKTILLIVLQLLLLALLLLTDGMNGFCFFTIDHLTRALQLQLYFLFFFCTLLLDPQSFIAFFIVVFQLSDSVLTLLEDDVGFLLNASPFFNPGHLCFPSFVVGRLLFTSHIFEEVGVFVGVITLHTLAFVGQGSIG